MRRAFNVSSVNWTTYSISYFVAGINRIRQNSQKKITDLSKNVGLAIIGKRYFHTFLKTANTAVRLCGIDFLLVGFKLCPLCPVVVGAEVGLCHEFTGFLFWA